MGKSSKSLFIGAIASALMASTAYSADLIPPPVVEFEPEYEIGGNLYLRGYVGFTNQEVDGLANAVLDGAAFEFLQADFESSGLFGGAVGYRVNNWFRADVSAEYRMRAGFDGFDRYDGDGDGLLTNMTVGNDGTNEYTADKSEFLILANAFVDLGSYHRISPYVGAGVGASYTMISNLQDINTPQSSTAYANDHGAWSFAWALYAGLGFEVNDHLTIDMGYRYLDIGDAESGDIISSNGTNAIVNPLEFEGITSHDFTLGFRWNFGEFGHSSHGYGHGGHASYGQISY